MVRSIILAACGAVLLAGCASVPREAGFSEVRDTVAERADAEVRWHRGTADAETEAAVAALLADSLTADAAVQIALLNAPALQALYEDLGVARADLVQAGLLRNPVFGAHPRWPLDGGTPELAFSVAFDFLGVLALPMRRAVAASAFEAAHLRATEAVLAHAAATRIAFVRALAAEQEVELMQQVVVATEAGFVAAQRLREAGNIRRLDLLQEQALYEQSRLDLEAAELRAAERRERLARAMGLWGEAVQVPLAGRLPDPPDDEPDLNDAVERRAVEASLALAAARADAEAVARRAGVADFESVLNTLELGAEVERESDGEWLLGPDVKVRLPLLDTGRARRDGARSALRAELARLEATAVDVRSAARTARARLAASRRQALHLRRVVLPLRSELTAEMQLQYNAMQVGVFHLLETRRREIEAGRAYLDALAAYHEARTELDLVLQGALLR